MFHHRSLSQTLGRSLTAQLPQVGTSRGSISIVHSDIYRHYVLGVRDSIVDYQPRFVASSRIVRRGFFKAKNGIDSKTAESSPISDGATGGIDLKQKIESINEKLNSNVATSTEEIGSTNRGKAWTYIKNVSSTAFTVLKDSTRSSMNWLGTTISTSVQRKAIQIQQQAQRSIETTRLRATHAMKGVRDRLTSNIRERTQALLSNIVAPIHSVWNAIANIWRTTPIWNRFFYWSLSAIAVYGIVTTLPKEILKILFIQQSTSTTTPPTTTTTTGSRNTNNQTPNGEELQNFVVPED